MKIIIEQNDSFKEPEITIKCSAVDPELEKLISSIRLFANTISGKKDNATHFVSLSDTEYVLEDDDGTQSTFIRSGDTPKSQEMPTEG